MYDISELAKKIGLKCNGKIVSLDIQRLIKIPVSYTGIRIILSSYVNIKKEGLLLQIQGKEYSNTI